MQKRRRPFGWRRLRPRYGTRSREAGGDMAAPAPV